MDDNETVDGGDQFRLGELEYVADLSPAHWVRETIRGFALDLASYIPACFDAYARVLHPAWRYIADPGEAESLARRSAMLGPRGPHYLPVRWQDIAKTNAAILHRQAQFEAISSNAPQQSGVLLVAPDTGRLTVGLQQRLAEILATHTGTPNTCWFCIWEGWGGLGAPKTALERVRLPYRDYLLFTGPLAAIQSIPKNRAPGSSLWWPDDRAWCVASEVDLDSTYLGGTSSCIDQIVNDPDLEALRAQIDDRPSQMDPINRPPPAL
jgi:hypothetical protein